MVLSPIGYKAQYTMGYVLCATMGDMNTIGERMADAAQEKWGGEWRVELRKATGYNRQMLHKIETGDTKSPRPDTLFSIADAVGVSARWLGTGEGPRSNEPTLTEEERRWLALREMLSPGQQHSLHRFLDAMGELPPEPDDASARRS